MEVIPIFLPPESYQVGQPVPLIVMLHGCTQTATDFANGTEMKSVSRAAWFHPALSATEEFFQSQTLLELVSPSQSTARLWRTSQDRRHDQEPATEYRLLED